MSTPPPRTIDGLVAWFEKQYDPAAAGDLHAIVLFDLAGDEGGRVVLRIEPGRLEVEEGTAGDPDLSLRVAAADFFAVLAGTRNVDELHLEGRLEVEGDLGLANRLRSFFPAR